MTFSIAARCSKTGMFGTAVSSSSPAVAARCAFARAGVGAAASQNITDPALGERCLDLMASGLNANQAIDEISATTEFIAYRQLTAVDASGASAYYSGANSLGNVGAATAADVACAGNLLATRDIPDLMVAAFNDSAGHLGERLLSVLQAAERAGGEQGPVHSAGLLVVDSQTWPIVSLRVDWHEDGDPIGELAKAWAVYAPQIDNYVIRARDPTKAPSYGVAGDQ